MLICVQISDGGSVEFHNRSSVRIGWCIRCDFADYNRFTHTDIVTDLSTFYAPEGNSGASGVFFCLCAKGNNWFSYITQGRTYCQSSRRLSVSKTSLPCGLVVHINLVIACFVQASDDRLLKMRIDHHNQQLLWLINRLFPIIGTSLVQILKKIISLTCIYILSHFKRSTKDMTVYLLFALHSGTYTPKIKFGEFR